MQNLTAMPHVAYFDYRDPMPSTPHLYVITPEGHLEVLDQEALRGVLARCGQKNPTVADAIALQRLYMPQVIVEGTRAIRQLTSSGPLAPQNWKMQPDLFLKLRAGEYDGRWFREHVRHFDLQGLGIYHPSYEHLKDPPSQQAALEVLRNRGHQFPFGTEIITREEYLQFSRYRGLNDESR